MNKTANNIEGSTNNKMFVISDLHIGDGSARDNLIKADKHILLSRLLDKIEHQQAQLVILGDFFELWRYPLENILEKWHTLIDRIAQMDVVYIPGNHDAMFEHRFENDRTMHPVFDKLRRPFVKTIGSKRFHFMHGHEVDPMITDNFSRWAPLMRVLTGAFEFRRDTCLMTSDRASDFLLEAGERLLHLWHTLTKQVNQAMYDHIGLSDERMTTLRRPIRTRNMLARFYQQQQADLYDVTITGHTHKAGRFGQWYFNSGCWTQNIVNYLMINPDGSIEVCNWTSQGSQINHTVVL